jgi:hypothetical protein
MIFVLSVLVLLFGFFMVCCVESLSIGEPARAIGKLANNTVCEVVATYSDPADEKNYVIVRTLEGSLQFIKTDAPRNIGYYKLKISKSGSVKIVDWIPFSTVETE